MDLADNLFLPWRLTSSLSIFFFLFSTSKKREKERERRWRKKLSAGRQVDV